jgi:hypothetical protein
VSTHRNRHAQQRSLQPCVDGINHIQNFSTHAQGAIYGEESLENVRTQVSTDGLSSKWREWHDLRRTAASQSRSTLIGGFLNERWPHPQLIIAPGMRLKR